MLIPAVARLPSISAATPSLLSIRSVPPAAFASTSFASSPFGSSSFWLGRSLLLRWVGGCYLVAFLVALRQNKALLGTHGLLPIAPFLEKARAQGDGFWKRPTLFWRTKARGVDRMLDVHAWVSAVRSKKRLFQLRRHLRALSPPSGRASARTAADRHRGGHCAAAVRALGALHLGRKCRTALVQLRLGVAIGVEISNRTTRMLSQVIVCLNAAAIGHS